MKKTILSIAGVAILLISAVVLAGIYKFNIKEDDIYVETSSGGSVKYNDIIETTSSIIPVSSVIAAVGGDYVFVNNVIPAGVSPHGFDMSAKAMAALEDSEIVFMTGLEHIDGFLEKAADGKKQVHLADGMELLEASAHDHHDEHGDEHDEHEDEHKEYSEEGHDDHKEDAHHDDDHHDEHEKEEHHDEDRHDDHGEENHSTDPHVWLGKDNIITIANTIRAELSEVLPEQAEYFAANTAAFTAEVEKTYADFAANTAGKTPGEFIVFHDAYNYLFQSIGLNPDLKRPFSENVLHESGTAHFAELTNEIKSHGIKYIFREPQFSDTAVQKFVDQYNLSVGTLDPHGTDTSATGYIANLQNNLSALETIYE